MQIDLLYEVDCKALQCYELYVFWDYYSSYSVVLKIQSGM